MPTERLFSTSYRDAVKAALLLQLVTTLFLLTVLDGGALAKVGGAAMAAFWIGVVIVMLRRPREPSPLDLAYVRWGYVAMLIIGITLSPLLGALRA